MTTIALPPIDDMARFVRRACVDRATAEVVRGFDRAGIRCILLKGAAFAALLYDPDELRAYTDADLLVDLVDRERAESILRHTGFARVDRDADWLEPTPKYARTFFRSSDGGRIDLHWSISGAARDSASVWSILDGHRAQFSVSGAPVWTLDAVASALLVALHSSHHGTERPQTLEDLDRAVQRIEFGTWQAATGLAHELEALPQLVAGLRLTAAGDQLADQLGLPRTSSTEMWLKTHESSNGARVLDKFSRTRSLRGRLRVIRLVIAPPPELMRAFFPLASRGRLGLALAYLLRPARLGMRAYPAAREWIKIRRTIRRARQSSV